MKTFTLVVLAMVAGLVSADNLDDKQVTTAGALPYNTLTPQTSAVIYHAQTYETAPKQLPVAPVSAPATSYYNPYALGNPLAYNSNNINNLFGYYNPGVINPYTAAPYTTVPYTTAPYTTAPYTTDPYTTVPYTSAPYTAAPYTAAPYTSAPYLANPYAYNPYVANPYGVNPYFGSPYTVPSAYPTVATSAAVESTNTNSNSNSKSDNQDVIVEN